MPPRRPLTDLDLISVFKMLTPNEQLMASKMSPRCAVLVRAANRRVKTLVITTWNTDELLTLKNIINSFSLAFEPSMQQLMDIPGETFPDYPMTTRLSEWNILRLGQLRLIDTATIEQIVTIFSAVTDLKFITLSSKHIGTLVSLLQHPNWQCQLTNLMVGSQLVGELIPAINGLTALQLLALDWDNYRDIPDLPILAQLKTVAFSSNRLSTFLRSLERNATDNADLEVHLISDDTNALFTLSQPLRSRIVCYGWGPLDYTDDQPSMKLLKDIPGETFPDYPMTTRLSERNILRLGQLRLIDTATIEQIVTIFSAVTDLKFIASDSKPIETLVFLLQHPKWQCQLTNLMVGEIYLMDSQLAGELITAINGLPALQLLVLDWFANTEIPDLPILAQLKTVVFKSYRLRAFLRSLERNSTDNADLEVHLLSDDTEALLTLSQPLRSRIVRYGWVQLHYIDDQVPLLCSQFRSLTSLEIEGIKSTQVGPLFTDLSQLHQLTHLSFWVDFSKVKNEFPLPARPLAQLNSVRALDLRLRIASHSQIEWLNLPRTMPNLKTIYILEFN
ncbi:hypothetical protein TYRP_015544, partial [Tyrophagus putrescentiae]